MPWSQPSAKNRARPASASAMLGLCVLIALVVASGAPARAQDDNENSTPTAWWIYTGQTLHDIGSTVASRNARIVDISADDPPSNRFTVTYVQNTASYAKQWWWYVGIDAAELAKNLSANNARLTALHAYDAGDGLRFAAAMISNTGADARAWWYYYGKSTADIASLTRANNARLTRLRSYTSNGHTVYAVIMIANTGAGAKGWWWYFHESPQAIAEAISSNNARLLDLTPADGGNFNVVMESCSSGCPAWWWYYGLDADGVLAKAQADGARVLAASVYRGCGSNICLATVMIANTPADITACDPQGCISEAKFAANLRTALADQVVGYSYLVGGMRPVAGGQARTSSNPPGLAMSSDLLTDIASVSKTMTSVGVLQLLARNGLTIDTKISPYLYADWNQGPNIDRLTFKELLTHTSGLGQLPQSLCGTSITYSALKAVVAGGVTAANLGKPSYGNCNFALLRELMPALLGQSLDKLPDGPQRAKQSSALYINYMNAHVFQPVGIPSRGCDPELGVILSYPFPAGSTSGLDWGDWSLQCGSGGWVLSANDIFKVVDDLVTGNVLLTAAWKKLMFNDCLGWDCAVRSDCPNPYVCKNGDLTNGSGISVWTYTGVFKCNVPVVVVVNSPLPAPYQNGGDIIGLVEDAYKNASVPGTPRACP
jgi:hypothetical protein